MQHRIRSGVWIHGAACGRLWYPNMNEFEPVPPDRQRAAKLGDSRRITAAAAVPRTGLALSRDQMI